ncbi:hypothetical protein L195_g014928 [Trifolium pratense]|uniref:Uncharacterized protein n=1 Tax=Trifolium pratense TaxID=57577 RepID=A0A2K3MLV0_TRIPR|nr:hypothetical protein L195_g014928 [Trifolium pratense]
MEEESQVVRSGDLLAPPVSAVTWYLPLRILDLRRSGGGSGFKQG